MPKISIILPVYKVEEHLNSCLQSLSNQTWQDYEIILVDDGSPDSSGRICEEWAKRDSRFLVFHKENGGVSDARNFGIEKASGEYLSFVDSDDYVAADYLSYLYDLITSEPNCKLSACNHFILRGNKEKTNSPISGRTVFSQTEAFRQVLYHGMLDVSSWGKLYHRSLFSDLRFPKGKLYEDSYLFGDLIRRSECIVFGGEPKYYYVQRSGSIVNSTFDSRKMQYCESVDRLCNLAMQTDPSLEKACVRRRVHASLSVLRYMKECRGEELLLRDELRKKVLSSSLTVLSDPNTPTRDRFAIRTLKMGYFPFYTAWKIYGFLR